MRYLRKMRHKQTDTVYGHLITFIIWWPNIISNKDLWKATGQEDINLEIRKRKFRWIGHTLRKKDGEVPKAAYFGTLNETGREEDRKTAGEDQ